MPHDFLPQLITRKAAGKKSLAILIDPDKAHPDAILDLLQQANQHGVDAFLVGGSLLKDDYIQQLVPLMKANTDIPVILFPGGVQQIVPSADGILFLSLISGRNPDLLIGQHVVAAPLLHQTDLEIIPTGYMLIESGRLTTAHYMSNTLPIPRDKADIATSTALAGEMLGLQLIYLEAGSGAQEAVPEEMIRSVSDHLSIPLIVGGGIRSAEAARQCWQAGADLLVIGSAIEKRPDLLPELCQVRLEMGEGVR